VKTSLRDLSHDLTGAPDPGIRLTKEEQQDIVTGLRRGTLARIATVTSVTHSTKVEKYDRIVEILESHRNDVRNVLSRRTVD